MAWLRVDFYDGIKEGRATAISLQGSAVIALTTPAEVRIYRCHTSLRFADGTRTRCEGGSTAWSRMHSSADVSPALKGHT